MNMNFLNQLPDKDELTAWYNKQNEIPPVNINGHIHTPYSFSAFQTIEEAITLAKNENIRVLGINDFFVTEGYNEFSSQCLENGIFPLFNIEFIGLDKDFQEEGIKVNDPNNPGRTYLSGKALNYPSTLMQKNSEKLETAIKASQKQVEQMIDKLNELLTTNGIDKQFSIDQIRSNYAKQLVRERHIATALRDFADKKYSDDKSKADFYEKLFSKQAQSNTNNKADIENEIRSNLLKSGGAAFVAEDENAFLPIDTIANIIIDAGGIPTYPLLLDGTNGDLTDFENDKEDLMEDLLARDIFSIEFIPSRNNLEILEEYAEFFFYNGFIVTFGTEHNSPKAAPLEVKCKNGIELTNRLKKIAFESTAILAAHQYLRTKGESGYLDIDGCADPDKKQCHIDLGKAVLAKYFEQYN